MSEEHTETLGSPLKHPVVQEWWQAFVTKPEHMFMWVLLLSLIVTFLSIVWTYHNRRGNKIDIIDLVAVDGKLDESKFNRFIAFVVSTWGFVWLLTTNQLKEWFFMAYMAAWVGNALFNRYLRIKDKESQHNYEIEKEVVEKKIGRMKKRTWGKGGDIEPYDPDEDDETEDDLPPANMKGRRRG